MKTTTKNWLVLNTKLSPAFNFNMAVRINLDSEGKSDGIIKCRLGYKVQAVTYHNGSKEPVMRFPINLN